MAEKLETAYDYTTLACAASELQSAIEDNWPETVKSGEFKKSEVIRILNNVCEFFSAQADAAANREIIEQGGKIDNSIPCRFAKIQRKFDPDGRITAIYMENPLLKLLLDAAMEKTGKTLFIKPLLKTIEGGKNEKVHQAPAQDRRGQQKLPIIRNQLIASPKGWETIVDLCNRRRSLKEVMSTAVVTMRESRALVARSRGKPYLATAFGQRTITGE